MKSRLAALLRSSVALGLLAVLGGLVAATTGRHFLQQRALQVESEALARYAMAPVVVAKRDLVAGERLEAVALAIRPMPRAFLPAGAIAPEDAAALIGRHLAADVKRGEAVQQVIVKPVMQSLAQVLPEGSRALTVAVDDLNAHGGLLRAGDVIDVYLVERGGTRSRIGLLQQKVRVLATGSRTAQATGNGEGPTGQDFGTITLQVDDAQARRLVLARDAGDLSFVLRARGDESPAPPQLLDSSRLLEAPEGRSSVQVIRADRNDVVELLLGGSGGPAPTRHWLRVGVPARSGVYP
jgi:pilus assembly protein CpaB